MRFSNGCYAFGGRLVYWEMVDWVAYEMIGLRNGWAMFRVRINTRITISLQMEVRYVGKDDLTVPLTRLRHLVGNRAQALWVLPIDVRFACVQIRPHILLSGRPGEPLRVDQNIRHK